MISSKIKRAVLGLTLAALMAACGTTVEAQEQRFKRATDAIEAVGTKNPTLKMAITAKVAEFKAEYAAIQAGTDAEKKKTDLAALAGRVEEYTKKVDPAVAIAAASKAAASAAKSAGSLGAAAHAAGMAAASAGGATAAAAASNAALAAQAAAMAAQAAASAAGMAGANGTQAGAQAAAMAASAAAMAASAANAGLGAVPVGIAPVGGKLGAPVPAPLGGKLGAPAPVAPASAVPPPPGGKLR